MTDKKAGRDSKGRFVGGHKGAGGGNKQNPFVKKVYAQVKEAGPEVIQKCIDLALEGNEACIKLLVERLVPTVKQSEQPVTVAIDSTMTATEQARVIRMSAAQGQITPHQANLLLTSIKTDQEIAASELLHSRLAVLEAKIAELK